MKTEGNFKKNINKISKKWGDTIGLDLPYFIKNGFWVLFRQGVGAITGLAVAVAFARLSSQEVFGHYQFIISILSLVSILSIPGLNTSIIRSVAKGYEGDYKKAVKTSFFWSLLGVPTLFILGGYYYQFQNHSLGIALMIASVFFPFFYAPNTWDSFLQGKSRFDVSAKFSSIQAIINATATIAIIFFFSNNLLAIITMYLASYAFFNGIYYWKSLKYIENKKENDETIKYGWFLTKMSFLGLIAGKADSILIGIVLGPIDLAVYTIVSLVAVKIKDFQKPLFSMLVPKLSNQKERIDTTIYKHKNSFIFLFIIVSLSSYLFYLLIPDINSFLFSQNYAEYSYLSQIFSITIFFGSLTSFLGYYSYAKSDKFTIFITNPIFYIIKIILNVILILKFQLVGAVIAFNIAMILLLLFYIVGISYNTTRSLQNKTTF